MSTFHLSYEVKRIDIGCHLLLTCFLLFLFFLDLLFFLCFNDLIQVFCFNFWSSFFIFMSFEYIFLRLWWFLFWRFRFLFWLFRFFLNWFFLNFNFLFFNFIFSYFRFFSFRLNLFVWFSCFLFFNFYILLFFLLIISLFFGICSFWSFFLLVSRIYSLPLWIILPSTSATSATSISSSSTSTTSSCLFRCNLLFAFDWFFRFLFRCLSLQKCLHDFISTSSLYFCLLFCRRVSSCHSPSSFLCIFDINRRICQIFHFFYFHFWRCSFSFWFLFLLRFNFLCTFLFFYIRFFFIFTFLRHWWIFFFNLFRTLFVFFGMFCFFSSTLLLHGLLFLRLRLCRNNLNSARVRSRKLRIGFNYRSLRLLLISLFLCKNCFEFIVLVTFRLSSDLLIIIIVKIINLPGPSFRLSLLLGLLHHNSLFIFVMNEERELVTGYRSNYISWKKMTEWGFLEFVT